MFIQDLTDCSVNVTAEIPEGHVATFQSICLEHHRMLAKKQNIVFPSVARSAALPIGKSLPANKSSNTQSNPNGDQTKNGYCGDQFEDEILHETAELLARSQHRTEWEQKILNSLISLVKPFDSMLKLEPIGSSSYGFGGSKTNFNIFIHECKYSMHLTKIQIFFIFLHISLFSICSKIIDTQYERFNRQTSSLFERHTFFE